jgi:hypothetical protein
MVNRLDDERWGQAMKEHDAILDCLVRRAGAELRELLRSHLMNKLSSLLSHLPQPEAETADAVKSGTRVATETGTEHRVSEAAIIREPARL